MKIVCWKCGMENIFKISNVNYNNLDEKELLFNYSQICTAAGILIADPCLTFLPINYRLSWQMPQCPHQFSAIYIYPCYILIHSPSLKILFFPKQTTVCSSTVVAKSHYFHAQKMKLLGRPHKELNTLKRVSNKHQSWKSTLTLI